MYGLSQEQVSWLVGREVLQLQIGMHEVIYAFRPTGHMMIEGAWELLDPSGKVLDCRMEHAARTEYRLHHLFDAVVVNVLVESSAKMVISFSNGFRLVVHDDDPRYEAVTMNPGDGRMIVI